MSVYCVCLYKGAPLVHRRSRWDLTSRAALSVIKDVLDYKLLQRRNNYRLFAGIWQNDAKGERAATSSVMTQGFGFVCCKWHESFST